MVDLRNAMLSAYPAEKIEVTCDTCMLNVRYDRLGMVEAGGDRPLDKLLEAIVQRNGCTLKQSNPAFDKCGAIYSNLPAEKPAAASNSYAKAKGG
ncbi:hypothetical protein MAUB1S_09738 [Mycolicibacterium aubagnense]